MPRRSPRTAVATPAVAAPSPPPTEGPNPPAGYAALLGDIRERIRAAQVRATLAVNRELVSLYWQIGHEILAR
jgi:hypothetical protein